MGKLPRPVEGGGISTGVLEGLPMAEIIVYLIGGVIYLVLVTATVLSARYVASP